MVYLQDERRLTFLLGGFTMQSVMGFEFETDEAGKIKGDNTAMRVLADLQEKGIAKISQTGYMCLPDCFF